MVNGAPAPIYNLVPSASLINIQLPSELPATGTASIMVTAANGASQSSTIALGPADVGIYRIIGPISPNQAPVFPNNGAIQFANTSWDVMPASMAHDYGLPACTGLPMNVLCGQPAKPGQNITIYWTGGGATNNPLPTGSIAPLDGSTLYSTIQQPTVTIGGFPAKVLFTGITPGSAGEYQINTTIPAGVQPGDQVPLVVSIGNTSDTVGIAIQAP